MELRFLMRPSKQRHSLHKVVGEEGILVEEVDTPMAEKAGLQVEMVGFQAGTIMLVVEMGDVILDIQMEVHLDVVEEDVDVDEDVRMDGVEEEGSAEL